MFSKSENTAMNMERNGLDKAGNLGVCSILKDRARESSDFSSLIPALRCSENGVNPVF